MKSPCTIFINIFHVKVSENWQQLFWTVRKKNFKLSSRLWKTFWTFLPFHITNSYTINYFLHKFEFERHSRTSYRHRMCQISVLVLRTLYGDHASYISTSLSHPTLTNHKSLPKRLIKWLMLIGTLWLYAPFYGQSHRADLLQCFCLIAANDWCRYRKPCIPYQWFNIHYVD